MAAIKDPETSQRTGTGAVEAVALAPVPRAPGELQRLKVGRIGLFGVLFMALANAAPITAMTGNVPIAISAGNGIYAPGGYLAATIVLTLFTIGYVSMARYITTTGAFYGFISHGLGQVWGMASGMLATMAYIVFEGSLIGIFAFFANDTIKQFTGVDISWLPIALVGIAAIAVLAYFDISIAAALLGFFLICEVTLLTLLSFSILFHGGKNGLVPSAINPINAFKNLPEGGGFGIKTAGAVLPAGAAGIGLFFAFWSWIGFETTAVYGEESRDPKRIIPRATLIAVVGLGLFFTFVSWMAIAGNGPKGAIDNAANNPLELFYSTTRTFLNPWAVHIYQVLIVMGSFACALAFHNAAARYLYAIGREAKHLSNNIGRTHHRHGSPHVASVLQSVITLVITLAFFVWKGNDPLNAAYIYEYGVLAVLGTMGILIVQAVTSVAVFWFFHVKKARPSNVLVTGVIPLVAAVGMLAVVYLLFKSLAVAGGSASGSGLFKAIPYIVGVTFVAGLAIAVYLRQTNRTRFDAIGRTVLDDVHERAA